MTSQVTKTVIVKADADRLYKLWSDFENFPHFMKYIKSVTKTGPNTSHWVLEGPLGVKVDWNAEMTRHEVNRRIGWSSKDLDGLIVTSGQVSFNPLPDKGETEIVATVNYSVPGGKVGEALANVLGDPEQRLQTDLHNFKAYAEGMLDRLPQGSD